MVYLQYVIAAYAVFVVVMLWDLIAPQIAIRQQLRAARLRAARLDPRLGIGQMDPLTGDSGAFPDPEPNQDRSRANRDRPDQ